MKRFILGLIVFGFITALLPIAAVNAQEVDTQEGIYLTDYTQPELEALVRAAGYRRVDCSQAVMQDEKVVGIPIEAQPPYSDFTPQCSALDLRSGDAVKIYVPTNLCFEDGFCLLIGGGGPVAVFHRDSERYVGFHFLPSLNR